MNLFPAGWIQSYIFSDIGQIKPLTQEDGGRGRRGRRREEERGGGGRGRGFRRREEEKNPRKTIKT